MADFGPITELKAPLGAVVKNEWVKLWARKRWVLVLGVLAMVVVGTLFSYNSMTQLAQANVAEASALQSSISQMKAQTAQATGKVRQQDQLQLVQMEQQLAQQTANKLAVAANLASNRASLKQEQGASRAYTQVAIQTDQFELHHGIRTVPTRTDGGWLLPGIVFGGAGVIALGFLVLLVAVDNVAGERQGATVPLMFLHAGNRVQSFMGKAITVVLTTWGMVVAAAVGFFVLGGLMMGFGSPAVPEVVGAQYGGSPQAFGYVSAHVVILSQLGFDVWAVVLACLSLAVWGVLLVGVSTFLSSSGLATGIGAAVILSAEFLAQLHSPLLLADPALHLSLMESWDGTLATQLQMGSATLTTGALVLAGWAALALGIGSWKFSHLEP